MSRPLLHLPPELGLQDRAYVDLMAADEAGWQAIRRCIPEARLQVHRVGNGVVRSIVWTESGAEYTCYAPALEKDDPAADLALTVARAYAAQAERKAA